MKPVDLLVSAKSQVHLEVIIGPTGHFPGTRYLNWGLFQPLTTPSPPLPRLSLCL